MLENLATLTKKLNEPELSVKAGNLALSVAGQRLRELRGETAGQRMRFAGQKIGLTEGERKDGETLWKLRSNKAAHPTEEDVTMDEVLLARTTARAYVGRYIEWRLANPA